MLLHWSKSGSQKPGYSDNKHTATHRGTTPVIYRGVFRPVSLPPYLLFFNTIRPTAQQQVFCCQSELMRKLALAADSVGLVSAPSTQWLGAGLCAQRWADDLCQDTLTLRASVSGRSVEESELSITK